MWRPPLMRCERRWARKTFRKKMFELSIEAAFQSWLPDWSDAERYRATDIITKLAGMLDASTPERTENCSNH